MIDHNNYALKALRPGQICVATDADGAHVAYRAVPAGDALRWQPLDPERSATQSAINGYCAFLAHAAEADYQPEYAVSKRQLAQYVANKAAVMTIGLTSSVPLVKIAHASTLAIVRAVLGNDIAQALSALPRLGLDIGCSRDRQSLQVVINIAEQADCEHLLSELHIKPFARSGYYAALRWINELATPKCLASLALLAPFNPAAADLAMQTSATVPSLAPALIHPMAMEA